MWRRPGLVTADTKSPAPQPGRNAWWRGSLRAGPGNGDGGGTWADNATTERREAGLPVAREGSCLASVASRVTARHVSRLDASGRSANPLARGVGSDEGEKRKKNPDAKRAGEEETGLFDSVNMNRRGAMHRQGAGASSCQRQRTRDLARGRASVCLTRVGERRALPRRRRGVGELGHHLGREQAHGRQRRARVE